MAVTTIPTNDESTDIRTFIWQSADAMNGAIQQALSEMR
jgi:hypothetical protein